MWLRYSYHSVWDLVPWLRRLWGELNQKETAECKKIKGRSMQDVNIYIYFLIFPTTEQQLTAVPELTPIHRCPCGRIFKLKHSFTYHQKNTCKFNRESGSFFFVSQNFSCNPATANPIKSLEFCKARLLNMSQQPCSFSLVSLSAFLLP